jgi:hypothetical protein
MFDQYPDLARPIEHGIYRPYGAGPFLLSPSGCTVADGGFTLDIVRPQPGTNTGGRADLEVRLDARYPRAEALAVLRRDRPGATLTDLPLTGWAFRLDPRSLPLAGPDELRAPIGLASNGLGSARLAIPLSTDSGLVLDALLREGHAPVDAFATAWITGVSPRVGAVVRFRTSVLLPTLTAQEPMSWADLAAHLTAHRAELPMEVSGSLGAESAVAFGETLADRLIARFGTWTPDGSAVLLTAPGQDGDVELFWSLSQPVLAVRRVVLRFDLLADVRRWIARDGIDTVVRWRTSGPLPFGEPPQVTVFCTLPPERRGLAALGATLTFEARPPERPHAETVTVELQPPEDLVRTPIALSPGEPLQYEYCAFAVLEDDQGVREVTGPRLPRRGTPLRLSPEDFPVTFVTVRAEAGLLGLATITGQCRYDHAGSAHTVPFDLGSGRTELALTLPEDAADVTIVCAATAPDGTRIDLGPFSGRQLSLDVTSFPGYGWHEIDIRCDFGGAGGVHAIDLLPEGSDEITVLAFTPDRTQRTFGWFAPSPFAPGFRYRTHRDDGADSGWSTVSDWAGPLLIRAGTTAGTRTSEVSVQLGTLNLLQPILVAAGQPPVSPAAEPTDLLLYHAPDDPGRTYYLPRYRLDVQTVSGRPQYRIAMALQNAAWTLTINLIKGPAEALGDTARDAEELPHDIAVSLSALQAPPSGARKVLPVQEVARNGPVVTVRLTFATLQERDEVYRALTEPARDATLTITRTIRVSVPVTTPQRPPVWAYTANVLDVAAIGPIRKPTLLGPLVDPAFVPPDIFVLPKVLKQPIGPGRPDDFLQPGFVNVADTLNLTVRRETSPLRGDIVFRAPLVDLGIPRFPGKGVLAPIGIRRPVPIEGPPIFVPRLPSPVLACTGIERRGDFTQVNLSITNFDAFPDDYFAPAPDLPPCGKNTSSSRTWVDIYDATTNIRVYGFCALGSSQDLQKLWFAVAAANPVPAQVYVSLVDRRVNLTMTSNTVSTAVPQPPPPPAYEQVVRDLEQTVSPHPLAFPPDLHGYMFAGIVPGGGGAGYIPFRLQWKNRFHTYLQDAGRPWLVYFFPDQFKIARRPTVPFSPLITVRVTSRTSTEDAEVVFDYIVAPHTEAERLRDAAGRLSADPRFGATASEFQPFLTSDVTFTIDRPTERGNVRETRAGVSQVLQGLLKDTIVMSLKDFGRLFDAMHLQTASLFLGDVRIDVPGGAAEVIGFTARLDDLAGEVFVCSAVADVSGAITVNLINAIESPIRINTLSAEAGAGTTIGPAEITGLTLPVDRLVPGRQVQMTVRPKATSIGSGPPQVRFSMQGVQVLPDPEAIWEAIVDRSAVAYFQTIKVNVVPGVFVPVADRPDDQIVAVQVAFEGGGTADLSADKLTEQVRVDYPIDDVVLRHEVDTSYRYRVTVIRASGVQQTDPEPSPPSRSPSLWVSVQK